MSSTTTGASTQTVGEAIDRVPLSAFQIRTIVLCGLVLVLDGFDAQSAGTLGASISENMHIPLKSMGPIFSASLVGLMLAAMAAGPIADRWGRKLPVVLSTITFALFSILAARAASFDQLLAFRFCTGLGLGGAMPTVVSIASEYSPKRLERTIVAALFAGMPLGGFICGLASSLMVHRWGWRSVFYLGGLFPLAVALLLIFALPESTRFLAVRGKSPTQISAIMARISPEFASAAMQFAPPRNPPRESWPVKRLFTEGRAAATILLWIPFFMNLLLLYFMISWLPALLRQSGTSISTGVIATTLFSLGGIAGSIAEGPLMNVLGAFSLLLVEFLLCSGLIGSLAYVSTSLLWLVFGVTFVLGFCVTGAQAGINAIAASFYPTSMRSTGVGWALGVGRIGSIVGPMITSALLVWRWTPQQIFLLGAAPALCAALALVLSYTLRSNASAYRRPTLVPTS
jgi:AAHS family 4-hydroxybenzoate transporter-like MFS transporter